MKMKLVIVLTLVLLTSYSIKVFGQQCDSFIVKETDKFTDHVQWRTKDIPVIPLEKNSEAVGLIIKRYHDNSVYFETLVESLSFGCVDKYSAIYFIFDDSSKVMSLNTADFNCRGECRVYLGRGLACDRKLKSALQEKRILSIRIDSRNSYISFDLTKEQAEAIYQSSRCIIPGKQLN